MNYDFMSWLRSALNLTQRDLANRMGISISYVKKLETNVKPINRDIERKVVSALGLNDEEMTRFKSLYLDVRSAVKASAR